MNIKFLVLLTLSIQQTCSAIVHADTKCQQAEHFLISHFSNKKQQSDLLTQLTIQREKFRQRRLERTFCHELLQNLKAKSRSSMRLSVESIVNHAILYEGFRIETYLSSGVAPKRYYGFFDEQGDTAGFEQALRTVLIDAVRIANEFSAYAQLESRITEKEVAFTFLAEGGALLLTDPEYSADKVHPIRHVGMDDFRIGFARFPELIERYDNFFGTNLGGLTISLLGQSILLRPMTFREALLGTTLMYLYEKEIAAHSMRSKWGSELMSLTVPEQFIVTSLVYNSGVLFAPERIKQILDLTTGSYLAMINDTSKRPKLPVFSPTEALDRLRHGFSIPAQMTSWSAVYHILQRYGAWVAVEKLSNVFTNESFTRRN